MTEKRCESRSSINPGLVLKCILCNPSVFLVCGCGPSYIIVSAYMFLQCQLKNNDFNPSGKSPHLTFCTGWYAFY
uniref:Uncharacterized protein n=1 Tax=Anguilla anguilla TaxID=7936 RepID=A0A0E9TLF4_ANGAN